MAAPTHSQNRGEKKQERPTKAEKVFNAMQRARKREESRKKS